MSFLYAIVISLCGIFPSCENDKDVPIQFDCIEKERPVKIEEFSVTPIDSKDIWVEDEQLKKRVDKELSIRKITNEVEEKA